MDGSSGRCSRNEMSNGCVNECILVKRLAMYMILCIRIPTAYLAIRMSNSRPILAP